MEANAQQDDVQRRQQQMRLIDAARRVYKSLHPGDFPPDNELLVIPWVRNYERYIEKVYGAENLDASKLAHLSAHLTPNMYAFVEGIDNWQNAKTNIIKLVGPSSEKVHALIRNLAQKPEEDPHAFCRRVLKVSSEVGRSQPAAVLRIYRDGLLGSVRDKLDLQAYNDLITLTAASQTAFQSFRTGLENTQRLNALESHLKGISNKIDDGISKINDKMISVLKVAENLSPAAESIHVQSVHQQPCTFASPHTPMGPHEMGWAQQPQVPSYSGVQCWECGGDHYKAGCPMLPPSQRWDDEGYGEDNRSYWDGEYDDYDPVGWPNPLGASDGQVHQQY